MIFDQGEPIFEIDTNRVFIGTGTLSGGAVIGSKNFTPLLNYQSLSNTSAEVGDMVNANNKWYQLTASDYSKIDSWADVGLRINTAMFKYESDNTLSFADDAVANYLSLSASDGVKIDPVDGILKSAYDPTTLALTAVSLSGNLLTVADDGINEYKIDQNTFDGTIAGGSGTKVGMTIGFGTGFNGVLPSYTPTYTLSANLADVDNVTIGNTGGVISISDTILDQIECVETFMLLSAYDGSYYTQGYPGQSSDNPISFFATELSSNAFTNHTILSALSSNGTHVDIVSLSSAGFLTFKARGSLNGQSIERFAIPIYTY